MVLYIIPCIWQALIQQPVDYEVLYIIPHTVKHAITSSSLIPLIRPRHGVPSQKIPQIPLANALNRYNLFKQFEQLKQLKQKMKIIEIDDDIHAHLIANVADFGETPSSVLRRLIKLNGGGGQKTSAPKEKTEIQKLIESSEFTYAKGVVGRFLVLLRWLHDADRSAFAKVLNIKGRGRLYFAKDAQTLEEAGKSVNPKQIPETPYWVITTTSTPLKQEILGLVMKDLGYPVSDIKTAITAIAV